MDITAYEKLTPKTSFYLNVTVDDLLFNENTVTIESKPEYGSIYLTGEMRESLCRYVGMPSVINRELYNTDTNLWYKVLSKLYSYHKMDEIILLITSDEGKYYVKSVCNTNREPLTSKLFIDQTIRYFLDDTSDISVVDINFSEDSPISTVTISSDKVYNSEDREFKIGAVLVNDETYNTSCRLVVILDAENSIIYNLPSKIYNLTSTRYSKASENSKEALEILLLRVKDDFENGYLDSKSTEITSHLDKLKKIPFSYNEYNTIRNSILNLCRASDIADEMIEDLMDRYEPLSDFDKLYSSFEGNYLRECTAISHNMFDNLLSIIETIPKDYHLYPIELHKFRDLLGEYLVLPRVYNYLSKRIL